MISNDDVLVWRAQQAPSMISNDDVLVWRAQQAPYHILSMVMCMACW